MVVCLKTLLLIQSKTLPKNYLNGIILLVKKKKIIQLSIKLKKKYQDVINSFILCVKEVQLKCVSHTIFT